MTVTTNTPSTVTLCGPVSAYTLASSTAGGAQGSITIGTQTFTIVSATTFTGPAAASVANGQNLCFALSLNGANQITAGTVTASTTPGPGYGTGTMQLCGVVTAYTAPTATGTGTIAVAGQTFTIAAGVTTTATISPGTSYCFLFTFGTGGQIATYTVSANLPAVSIVCGVFTAYTPAAGGAPAYMWVGGISFPVQTTFVPVYLVRAQVYCFLLGTTGYVVGLLSGVPTLATPYEAAGSAHRVGRLLAQ
ncbi:MAG: hypothetical protein JOZ41_01550 [Chloroflexi bacterium]|nr:hypothetical protein [Chloroflexota bacterium]